MSRGRRGRGALAAVAAALVLGAALGPAAAASADTAGSSWWYDKYDVAGAQAAGWDGSGVTIAVIDGQIDPDLPVLKGADLDVVEPGLCGMPAATSEANSDSVHGTDVTSLLIGTGTGTGNVRGIAPKAHVIFYGNAAGGGKVGCSSTAADGTPSSDFAVGIRAAVAAGARVISISQASSAYTDDQLSAIAFAISKGVVIVAADENDPKGDQDFPAVAAGVVGVNAFKPDGTLQTTDGVTASWQDTVVVAPGWQFPTQATDQPTWTWGESNRYVSGSSLATPLVAGIVALTAQKYPSATGDQLIQSLIRNTGAADHPFQRDAAGFGWGAASLTHMLRVDPTQYADENPLLDKPGGLGKPTAADIASAGQSATPSPSGSTHGGSGSGGLGALMPVVVIVGVVALLIVIAVVVVVIVLLTRRGRGTGGPR